MPATIGQHRRPRQLSRAAIGRVAAVVASFLLVSLLVVAGSRAAFTATTVNTGNQVAAGTVVLTDNDLGTALFNVSNMKPGDSISRCIKVTYEGTIPDPSPVKLYSGGYTDSGALGTYLDLTVEEGTGDLLGTCTTFVSTATIVSKTLFDFNAQNNGYGTGVGTWDPVSTPESKTYRITLALQAGTPNSQQGKTVTALGFTWEVQS